MKSSVTRFEEISVKGFRRLHDVRVPLRPLSVLIGANGIGKTSVLDVLSLLASSAEGSLNTTISEWSGLSSILTYDRAERLCLGISLRHSAEDSLKYKLCVEPLGAAYLIRHEELDQQDGGTRFLHIFARASDIQYYEGEHKLVRPSWKYNPLESALAQVPKNFPAPEEFRSMLASSTSYHVLNVDPRSPIRLPQPLQPAVLPGKNGEDLVSCLFNMREAHRDRFDAVEDALRAAFPLFQRLDFPPVAAGTLAMTWRESDFTKPLYMHQLSEGTLRFLWLTTLLQSPGLTALTLLDEPEVSLHPELLNLLAGLLREASQRTQLVVATHSDRLIRFLKPSEVIVMDSTEDGMATATWADNLDIEEWLKEYSLDELWDHGRIGARA